MQIIDGDEFSSWRENLSGKSSDAEVSAAVEKIIAAVQTEGDKAVRRFAAQFDKSSPEQFELNADAARTAWDSLVKSDPGLANALKLAADHIARFSKEQKAQFKNFEFEIEPGIFTGQRIIPVQKAAIYAPGGRFPLISSVLMGIIPALTAGVEEVILTSPPLEDGLPDRRILAAAHIAAQGSAQGTAPKGLRIFALGGAQAIAALALGTETVPRVDVIAGPGNKYVAAAKRLLFGRVGIDFIAGPTDVLIIADGNCAGDSAGSAAKAADIIAADMLAQAEHDPDARARALVNSRELAELVAAAVEKRLANLPTAETARASLARGGLIIIYKNKAEAVRIANTIAPEHLELQTASAEDWIGELKNYGSLFIGNEAAEVLGDYSAGINHTLPTNASARFTGGLGVRHFLKTVTTLRCVPGAAYKTALDAAEKIALAEGLAAHAESARSRS
ncbi:histidinol dehydrogenase [Spirochaetia bacterium]|nr:histidinol dehydrogenase [Spirochaetia bacterium]